jgi:hypothetical protein
MLQMKAVWLAVTGLALLGCSSDPEPPGSAVPELPASVEIGTPGGDNGLSFVPLEANGTLYVETFGQGGTHVSFSIRCNGMGNRAFVGVTLTNLETGVQVATPTTPRPQLLVCIDERSCDLVPLLVMLGGITEPGVDREGLHVRVEAEAHTVEGARAAAEAEGILNTERL